MNVMARQTKLINPGGITGSGKGLVNTNSSDYKGLQEAILEHAHKQTPQEKIRYKLASLRFQMERYLAEQYPGRIIDAGEFLKKHIDAIGIKNKEFANFIDLEESNLSAILNGRRKINTELGLKLGQVFDTDPNLWFQIQTRNELLRMNNKRTLGKKQYKLEDLLNQTG